MKIVRVTVALVSLGLAAAVAATGSASAVSAQISGGLIKLASQVSGILPVANGGTGASTLTGLTLPQLTANGITFAWATKTANYTLTANDVGILADTSGGTFTLSLPTAASIAGRTYVVANDGTTSVTIDPNGSETIAGSSTYSLVKDVITFRSDGTNWRIVAAAGSQLAAPGADTLYYYNNTTKTLAAVTIGSGITFSSGTLSASGGGGGGVAHYILASDETVNSATFATKVDPSFSLAANTDYVLDCVGTSTNETSGTRGVSISINGPASPTLLRWIFSGGQNGAYGSPRYHQAYTTYNADTGYDVASSQGATPNPWSLHAAIKNGSNTGALVITAKDNGTDGTKIKAGTSCTLVGG